jgi:branched-chain amino acid transport system ATP-binding protein
VSAGEPGAGEPLLALSHVETYYGDSHILYDLSLEVGEGEVVCLLGRNGAGKTTTVRSIIGLTPPRAGRVSFAGRDIGGLAPYRIARLGVGFVPEDRRVFGNLTVQENLEVARRTWAGAGPETAAGRAGGAAAGAWTAERLYDLFPVLRERRGQHAGTLSGGEQQMLTIARTLMGSPRLLLLDEPSEGLAPLVVDMLREQLGRLKGTGLTMILAEQNIRFVSDLGDRVYILENGMVKYQGSMASFLGDEEVRLAYLAV